MTSTPFNSITLFILLLFIVLLHSTTPVLVHALPSLVRIPSGRTIPLTLLTQHFPSLPKTDAIKRLYEIAPDFQLIGHHINLSMHSITNDEPTVIRHQPSTVLLNGRRIAPLHLDVHVRKGKLRVAHTPDGTVLGVWGPGISLHPLDLVKHPGIYINSPPSSNHHSNIPGIQYHHHVLTRTENPYPDTPLPIASSLHDQTATDYALPFSVRKATCEKKSKTKMVEFAVAFSTRLCSRYGSFKTTLRALLAMFMFASEPYEYQTCLFFKIVTFDGYCSTTHDPYYNYKQRFTSTNQDRSFEMLGAFADYWFKNRKSVKRDLAYFVPAFDGSAIPVGGVAYLAGVCSKYSGYGWVSTQHPTVVAHEVGHSFNASHSHAGIMSASLNVLQAPEYFMSSSADEISRFAETRHCLGLGKNAKSKHQGQQRQNTCGFKFPAQLGFMCKTSQLPAFTWKNGASVEKQISLANDEIQVSLTMKSKTMNEKSSSMFRFKRILIDVSTNDTVTELGQAKHHSRLRTIQSNTQRFTKKVSASDLKTKHRWTTCCDRPISIYIFVEIEAYKSGRRKKKKWSAFASRRHMWILPCTSCATKIIPMSANRKCPSCV